MMIIILKFSADARGLRERRHRHSPTLPPIADPADLPLARKYLIFGIMAFGQFMALIDIQIVAASLNDVQAGLSAGPDEISWVQTGYLMAELVMIPFAAFLAQALSTRWLFALSAGLFTLASALCGMAWNIHSMTAFRVDPGLRRRRDGADRVRHRLHPVHRQAARDDPGDPRHGLGAGADARARPSAAGSPTRSAGARSSTSTSCPASRSPCCRSCSSRSTAPNLSMLKRID